MKNILVPTDLTQQSLDVVHQIVKKNKNQQVNIYLLHLVSIPTDLSDLLFLKKSKLYDLVPAAFFRSIQSLKDTYPKNINLLRFEFYYGDRSGILKSIVENLKIDEICVLNEYQYTLPLEQSVDMIPFIERCHVPVFSVQRYGQVSMPGISIKTPSFLKQENHKVAMQ